MSDIDVEMTTEEQEEPERRYYVDQIELPELRRYVAIDMARMCDPLPDKVMKLAREIEAFLLGEPEKRAKLKVVDD